MAGLFETVPAAVDSVVGEFSPSAEPVVFGVNFRDTLGYVTDPPGTAGWVRNEQYPTTRAGITFGMVAPPNSYYSRNRNASTDPRLAGLTQIQNSGVLPHRIDLLRGPNTYRVRIAAGDFSNQKTQNLRIRDGAGGPVLLQFSGVVSAANQFLDATGVARTAAQWPSNNVPVDLIFTADHCIIELGQGAGGSTSNDTGLAHISFEYFPPAPTEFDGVIAESLPPATDAITGTFAAPIYTAAITEAVPAALDAGTGAVVVPGYAASIAESVPAASDMLLMGYALAPVAGDVAELVPAAVDAAQGSFALDAAGAVIAESVPAAVDRLTGSVSVPIFSGAVAEVLPPAADQVSAQFAPHRFAAVVVEVVPSSHDSVAASFSPAADDNVIAEQVPAAADVLYATASVPQYVAALAEVLPAATDAVQATSKEKVYHPSAERTLFIEPERRVFVVEPESRVLLIAPESRTLFIGA